MPNKTKAKVGDKHERLTVVRILDVKNSKPRTAEMLCDCGITKKFVIANVLNGHTKSCGCFLKDVSTKRFKTHGLRKHPLYGIWAGIKDRTTNTKNCSYDDYGGRGIKICKRWIQFENFFADMSESYEAHCAKHSRRETSLERRHNNRNYTQKNCKWATHHEQSRNKRNNRNITYGGETRCLVDWAKVVDIKYHTLITRIDQLGWSVQKAFNTPLRGSAN
jgi:hypothetical protein